MVNEPLSLTVVVPTLNVKRTIRTTLESLAPLRDAGASIIIVDSFSDDGTLEAAAGLYDQLLTTPRGSMYAAINAGIAAASTDWVSYLNADDIVFADILLKELGKIEATTDLIYGDVDFIDFNGRFLHSYSFPGPKEIVPLATSYICAISPIGTFFRKTLWEKLKGFDTTYRYSADFDFLLRVAISGAEMKKISGPTVGAFRLHGKQLSQNEGQPGLNENYKIIDRMNLKVSRFRKVFSLLKFKIGNFWELLIRALRHRRLTGSGFSECITPPTYQKD